MSAVSHSDLIPGPVCTGSVRGARVPGEVRDKRFPLPNRGKQGWGGQPRKPGSLTPSVPLPVPSLSPALPAQALLHGYTQAVRAVES